MYLGVEGYARLERGCYRLWRTIGIFRALSIWRYSYVQVGRAAQGYGALRMW